MVTLTSVARPGNKRDSCGGGRAEHSLAHRVVSRCARGTGGPDEPATGVDASGDDRRRTVPRRAVERRAPPGGPPGAGRTTSSVIVKEAAESPEQRLLVAEYDGEPAGAVLLRVTPMTPLNLEPTVQALSPHVTPSYRGKGIGSALMEAAVLWAEELGIGHITTAAAVVLAQRQPVHGPALARARRRCSARPRPRWSAPSSPPSSRPAPGSRDRTAGRRHLGQVLAARRALGQSGPDDRTPATRVLTSRLTVAVALAD